MLNQLGEKLRVQLRPLRAGGELLELGIYGERANGEQAARHNIPKQHG